MGDLHHLVGEKTDGAREFSPGAQIFILFIYLFIFSCLVWVENWRENFGWEGFEVKCLFALPFPSC